jgi:hypothetical protein
MFAIFFGKTCVMNFVLKFGKNSRSDIRKEVSGRKRRAITDETLQYVKEKLQRVQVCQFLASPNISIKTHITRPKYIQVTEVLLFKVTV